MDKSKVVILIVAAMLIAASATAGVIWYLNNTNKYHQVFLDKCTIDIKGAESLAIYDEPKSETKNTLSTMMIMDADSGPGHFIYKVDSEGNQTPAKIYDEGGKEVFPDRPPTHITDCDNILFFDFMDNDYESYSKKSQDQYRCQLYAVNKETGKIYLIAQTDTGYCSMSMLNQSYTVVSNIVNYCGTTSDGTYVSLQNGGYVSEDGWRESDIHYYGVYLITFENDLINLKQVSPIPGNEHWNTNNIDKPFYSETHVFEDNYGTMIYYKESDNYYVQSETMGIVKCNEYRDLGFGLCNNIVYDDVFPKECDKLLSNGTTEHLSLTTEQSYRAAIFTYSTGEPLFNPTIYDDHARVIYRDHIVTIHNNLTISDEIVPIDAEKSLFVKDVVFDINENSVDIYSYRSNTLMNIDLTEYNISYLKKWPSAEIDFPYNIWDNGTYGCYYNVEKQMIVIEGVKGTFDTVTFCIYSNGYISHDLSKFQSVVIQIAPLN